LDYYQGPLLSFDTSAPHSAQTDIPSTDCPEHLLSGEALISRRTESRVEAEVHVRLLGIDADGKPFNVETWTRDISLTGARILDIGHKVRLGDILGMQAPTGRGRFRVTGFGKKGTPHEGEISLSCVEPGKCIWDPKLFATAPEKGSLSRRKAERFLCSGTAEVSTDGGMPLWCKLADISHTGCYLEISAPLPPGSQVRVTLSVGEAVIQAEAEVRTAHNTVGMGLAFRHMSPENLARFQKLMQQLAGIYEECEHARTGRSPQWDSNMKSCEESLQSLLGLIDEGMVEPDLAIISDLEKLLKGVTDLWESAQAKLTVDK
jgi:hypothetical protein